MIANFHAIFAVLPQDSRHGQIFAFAFINVFHCEALPGAACKTLLQIGEDGPKALDVRHDLFRKNVNISVITLFDDPACALYEG